MFLVSGATGNVGGELVRALAAAGLTASGLLVCVREQLTLTGRRSSANPSNTGCLSPAH